MTRNKKLFLWTILIGLTAHGFRMTNTMLNADSTNYLESISASWVTSLGRFLLPVVEKIRGNYELPWLIGIFCLLLLSASAVLIAEIFDIKGTIAIILTAGIIAANPVVTSIFSYMYTADGYMLALFFSVLAVYFSVKLKGAKGMVLGGVSLFLSLGFYQAFLSVTMLLMILYLCTILLQGKNPWKAFGKQIGTFAAAGAGGVLVYFLVLKMVWKVFGYGTTSYMGMNEAGGPGPDKLGAAFQDCMIDFARYFIVRFQINSYNVMNVLFFLLLLLTVIMVITGKKLWRQPGRWIVIAVLLCLVPFAGFIFEFTSEQLSYTSTSMEYSLNLLYLYPVVFWQSTDIGAGELREWKQKEYRKKKWPWMAVTTLLFCIVFHFTVISNQAYRSMENANTKVLMLLNRMEERMELQEEYEPDMEVAIVGSCYQIPEYVHAAPMMSGVVSNVFLTQPGEYINLLNWYLGTDYVAAGEARTGQLVRKNEFSDMEMWPKESAVKVIDGTMVLYLSDTDLDELLEND